jgi:uncharacterized protein with GYD domain
VATYITLITWTEQGLRDVKNTVARGEQGQRAIEQAGGRVLGTYWTQGSFDVVLIAEFPDDETAAAFFLAAGQQGYFRTETLRAFTAEEMQRVLRKLP